MEQAGIAEQGVPPGVERSGVLLKVAYDGAPFAGFARQVGARTIAGELQGAIAELDPRASLVCGASRTDAGVHAKGQLVAFTPATDIPLRGWVHGLNRHLPREVSVVAATYVPPGFVPHRHTASKTYEYRVLQSSIRDPFLEGRVWRVPNRLNHMLMREAAETLLGTHDFAAFRSSRDDRKDTTRRIDRISLEADLADFRAFRVVISGDRFMHNMVRIIVGTLVDIGRGRTEKSALSRALRSGCRSDLGMTAPSAGLCLVEIELAVAITGWWPAPSAS